MRASQCVDFSVNQIGVRLWDFLLVTHGNVGHISHLFGDTATY